MILLQNDVIMYITEEIINCDFVAKLESEML